MSGPLPIHGVRGEIVAGLRRTGRLVLCAPTGSGKSTQVPQFLLDEGLAGEGEVVVLQPRRIAARLLARRVAQERGGRAGEEVGYQVRFENVVSRQTRIRFVTEAILLRRILAEPSLPGVGALVFDEFHERSLHSDLALACAMDSLRTCRSDLKLVVMSATLDVAAVQAYLGECARVEAGGRAHPVDIAYTGAALRRDAPPVWERAAAAFRDLAREGQPGHVLVFMPGAFEIRRTIEAIEALPETRGREVLPLHGELPPEAQDRAVEPSDRPKVIVSTNVAETSLTIDGVCAVIDGGLARVAEYDPRRGVNSILVRPISRASAEQRAGRAGRTAPGRCLRLWSESEHAARPSAAKPEVGRVDLSEACLLLAAAGITDLDTFPWFEVPPPASLEHARVLLHDLGATGTDGAVTPTGRRMAAFPLHPRYARMLLEAERLGVVPAVARIAALSQGRAPYRAAREEAVRREQEKRVEAEAGTRSDFLVHLRALDLAEAAGFRREACEAIGVHGLAARQVRMAADQILDICRRQGLDLTEAASPNRTERVARCLLAGFSDHLGKRTSRGTRRCLLVHGRTGELRRESVVEADLLVAAEIEERELRGGVDILLGMATAVEPAWLEELFPGDFEQEEGAVFDPAQRRVVLRRERRFRGLVLESSDGGEPAPGIAPALLAAEVAAGRLVLKRWDAEVENWIRRVNFVARHCPETGVGTIDEDARLLLVEQVCEGAVSYREIKDRPVLPVVRDWISPEQVYYLDHYAPAEWTLPRRKRPVRVRYEEDGRAFLSVKLQDLYDVPGSSLKVADGRVPLTLEILAPNGRPAHVTGDLDGFWEGAYLQVRKDLAGRYPKHEWR